MTRNEPQVRATARGSLRASKAVRLGVATLAVVYIGYLSLLVTCDLRRVASLGFVPRYESDAVIVSDLQPDSIGARGGLQAGDRIRRANGQTLEGSRGLGARARSPGSLEAPGSRRRSSIALSNRPFAAPCRTE